MGKDLEQSFIARLGRSKMEKLQDLFTMTDKDTGISVFKTVGGNPFFMWWYIEGMCYGKRKVETFPKMDTLVKKIGKGETTIRGWLRKLEDAKAIKRVPVYLKKTGTQTSNLILVNAEFPNIPEEWDEVYKHGAIKDGKRFFPRENPNRDTRQKSAGALNQELYVSDEANETPSLLPGKNLPGSNEGPAGFCWVTRQKPAAPPQPDNPDITRDEVPFFEGEEEKVNKRNKKDDDDITPTSDWKKDSTYTDYRNRIIDGNGEDIAIHSQHYPVFRQLVNEIGAGEIFPMLDKYIMAVTNGEHSHKTPQAIWFLKGGWKNYDHREPTKPKRSPGSRKQSKKEEPLPNAIAQAMEREVRGEKVSVQEVDPETEARLQAKLDRMNQRLAQREKTTS